MRTCTFSLFLKRLKSRRFEDYSGYRLWRWFKKLNAQQGFLPAAVAPSYAITPDRCCVIIARCKGGMEGQALSPPSSYLCFLFHILTENSAGQKYPNDLYDSIFEVILLGDQVI
jgi:hypothetical protein